MPTLLQQTNHRPAKPPAERHNLLTGKFSVRQIERVQRSGIYSTYSVTSDLLPTGPDPFATLAPMEPHPSMDSPGGALLTAVRGEE